MNDLSKLHALAIEAAQAPSQLILSGFRSPSLVTEHKSDGSPVRRKEGVVGVDGARKQGLLIAFEHSSSKLNPAA